MASDIDVNVNAASLSAGTMDGHCRDPTIGSDLTPVLQAVSMMAVSHRAPLIPRLSAKEALILDLLRGSEKYGLELVTASDGALKRGTVYVTLGRMEDKGLIVSRVADTAPALGGLPRRLYKPTAYGKQLLSATLSVRRRLMPRFAR